MSSKTFSVTKFFISFFFQAEDGIRDVAVTGVQTCALPIFGRLFLGSTGTIRANNNTTITLTGAGNASLPVFANRLTPGNRSEERRVGKECRSRWSPYH